MRRWNRWSGVLEFEKFSVFMQEHINSEIIIEEFYIMLFILFILLLSEESQNIETETLRFFFYISWYFMVQIIKKRSSYKYLKNIQPIIFLSSLFMLNAKFSFQPSSCQNYFVCVSFIYWNLSSIVYRVHCFIDFTKD